MESLDNPKISNGITVASFLLEAIDFFILHWSPILSIILIAVLGITVFIQTSKRKKLNQIITEKESRNTDLSNQIKQLQNEKSSLQSECNELKNEHSTLQQEYKKTRSHTDGFGENNAKCLRPKGICGFVPDSSIYGF